MAIYRAKSKNIPIILGSATPSSETIFNVTNKKFTHIKMRNKLNDKPLPVLKVVDMSKKENAILSDDVIQAVKNRLSKKEQTLIYLNRRGYSSNKLQRVLLIPKCSLCNLNMTFHKTKIC